jgi:hypothetical protein
VFYVTKPCVTSAKLKVYADLHPLPSSLSCAEYVITQHLNHKEDCTNAPTNQKEIEVSWHVIQVEAVISTVRVIVSYHSGT